MAAGQFETCAKRQKWRLKLQEKEEAAVCPPTLSPPLPRLCSLLFVARVRDLLNL